MTTGTIDNVTVKLTISLPDDLAEEARAAVRRGVAPSVSAYIAMTIGSFMQIPTLRELLDEWDEELGPVPEEVKRQVDAEMEEAERLAAERADPEVQRRFRDRRLL